MRAILYSPNDAPLIEMALTLFDHIEQCANCRHHAYNDGEVAISELFGCLNALTTDDIQTHDYEAAIEFCLYWLDRHEMMSDLDMLIATPVGHA